MLEIRKVIISEPTFRMYSGTFIAIRKMIRYYRIIENGRLVDSFLYKVNAQRRLRELKRKEGRPSN